MIKKIVFGLSLILATSTFANTTIKVVTSMSEPYSSIGLMPEFCKKFDANVIVHQKPAGVFDAAIGGLALLNRGEYDVVSGTLPPVLISNSNGHEIYPISNVAADGINFIVNKSINSYADLKGKKIAQLRGSATIVQIDKKLKEVGLTLKDISIVYMSFEQMPIAFENGNIDGFIGSYPYTLNAITAGGKSIDNFPSVIRLMYSISSVDKNKQSIFRKCNYELSNFINNPQNKDAINILVSNARKNGMIINLPSASKYAYKLVPIADDIHLEEIVQFLKQEKKIRNDYVMPKDFNKTKIQF